MEQRVAQMLKDIFQLNQSADFNEVVLDDLSTWDSFNIVLMLTEFDEKYHIFLSLRDLEEFITMYDVYEWAIKSLKIV